MSGRTRKDLRQSLITGQPVIVVIEIVRYSRRIKNLERVSEVFCSRSIGSECYNIVVDSVLQCREPLKDVLVGLQRDTINLLTTV